MDVYASIFQASSALNDEETTSIAKKAISYAHAFATEDADQSEQKSVLPSQRNCQQDSNKNRQAPFPSQLLTKVLTYLDHKEFIKIY